MGKGAAAAAGHYRSPAEGGTPPAETASHWAAAGSPAKPALQPRLRGVGRPLLAAARSLPAVLRVLRSSYCSARTGRWCEEEGQGRRVGVRAPREWPVFPVFSCPLRRGFLTWGLQSCFPVSAAPACPSAAGLPSQSEPVQEPAVLSKQSILVSAAAAGREGGSDRRLLLGGVWGPRARREEPPSGASAAGGEGCGCEGRGLAAGTRAEAGKGLESAARERPGCLRVWRRRREGFGPWGGGAEACPCQGPRISRRFRLAGLAKERGTQ